MLSSTDCFILQICRDAPLISHEDPNVIDKCDHNVKSPRLDPTWFIFWAALE